MSDYPTRPDTPTGSTFWDVAERLLSGLRWERRRVQGDNRIFRRQMAPEVRHLFADSPLPVYPRYNNRDHYPVEAPEPTQDDPHFEIGWPAPPSPGLEPTPFDMVLMKGWGGRTEHPLAPPKSPSVLSLEEYLERQDRLTQDQDQESSQDSDEEEYEPEVIRTGELQLAYPPSPVYAPEESSDSDSASSESSGELRIMELDLERRVEEQTREFEEVSARLRAAQRRLMSGPCRLSPLLSLSSGYVLYTYESGGGQDKAN
ncbi:hypothetical protein RhiJN_11537 [Ceratobasidium sp. AG-Ba]|nr:hypothetical protein RhiJN_11537 [Ceratobasidium sp. AG-Ba]QRW12234.1 hypothetical protein RhiLY_11233 [Ceratobasidium sp. AG-Ba]